MLEKNKFSKQTRYLIQDLYAGSLSALPFLKLSGNNAWLLPDQARESRHTKRKRAKKKEEFSTVFEEPAISSSRSVSLPTTSSIAKRSKTSSCNRKRGGSNQSTLSMISTPWSTESSHGNESLRWGLYSGSTHSTTTLNPRTTSTIGGSSSNGLSAFLSKDSMQTFDKERPEHVKFVHIEAPERQRSAFSSNSIITPSWTLDAFSSADNFSDRVKVQYPWSPSTNDQIDMSIEYPSSFTLVSQKCSWETINERHAMKEYSPMNHIPSSGDIHLNHDWMLVKEKGIISSPV